MQNWHLPINTASDTHILKFIPDYLIKSGLSSGRMYFLAALALIGASVLFVKKFLNNISFLGNIKFSILLWSKVPKQVLASEGFF